jgi:hypothetical protein
MLDQESGSSSEEFHPKSTEKNQPILASSDGGEIRILAKLN